MTNINDAFRTKGVSIDGKTYLVTGTADPSIGAGFNATQGSIYMRSSATTTGEAYIKFGPANVDWQKIDVGGAGGSSIFGSEYQTAISPSVTTTTSQTFLNKAKLTTTSLPAGLYRVSVRYGWNHSKDEKSFEARVREDSVDVGELHRSEAITHDGSFSTTGSAQRYYVNRVFNRTLSAGVHVFDYDFRATSNKAVSSWEVTIELWRIS